MTLKPGVNVISKSITFQSKQLMTRFSESNQLSSHLVNSDSLTSSKVSQSMPSAIENQSQFQLCLSSIHACTTMQLLANSSILPPSSWRMHTVFDPRARKTSHLFSPLRIVIAHQPRIAINLAINGFNLSAASNTEAVTSYLRQGVDELVFNPQLSHSPSSLPAWFSRWCPGEPLLGAHVYVCPSTLFMLR
jgi:hypothetical protein